MTLPVKTRVFTDGNSQHVVIPPEFRFNTGEVHVRRDADTGDLILSPKPNSWKEVFAALDAAGFPEDFLQDRAQGTPEVRSPESG